MSYPLSLPASKSLITLTHPKDHLWVIELHNGQDSRLTTQLIDRGLKPALDAVEKHWRENWRTTHNSKDKSAGKGALIIVGRRDQNKFFSNGLDVDNIVNDLNFMASNHFQPLTSPAIDFSKWVYDKTVLWFNRRNQTVPTVAAINGHAFAAAFILSLACDYRVMTDGSSRNAWLCMNEVHFGAIWPLSFGAVLRGKVGDGRLHRMIALEGHRFTPQEALNLGLVDHIVKGGTTAVLAKATDVAESVSSNAQMGVWGLIKVDLYRDALETISKEARRPNAYALIEDAAARARL